MHGSLFVDDTTLIVVISDEGGVNDNLETMEMIMDYRTNTAPLLPIILIYFVLFN